MTTCDNEHDPITFEGEFRALCPLCAARAELREAEERISGLERDLDEAPTAEDLIKAEREAANFEKRCDENEAAIWAIVNNEGEAREEAIKAAAKLID